MGTTAITIATTTAWSSDYFLCLNRSDRQLVLGPLFLGIGKDHPSRAIFHQMPNTVLTREHECSEVAYALVADCG